MKNKESFFYIISSVISLVAVAFIIMICRSYFQNSDNDGDISEFIETGEETSVTEAFDKNSSGTLKQFFGVDVIEIN